MGFRFTYHRGNTPLVSGSYYSMKKRFITVFFFLIFILSITVNGNSAPVVQQNGDLSIHFLELGNKYTGDCIYINYGEIDILIDAGSRQSSVATIKAYIDTYITDGKLEFVIATHAHQDHIAGFYSSAVVPGLFEVYEIGIIIDFPKTNSTTRTYHNYLDARSKAVDKGAVHFTALQCYKNEAGAQRIYDLGGELKLEILYNYYYENETRHENNYSVCLRITQNDRSYLFTGDLEKEGEEKLVEYYEKNHGGLGHHVLYKGGHHGSNTSSSEALMAAISPEYVIVCSCVGSSEYKASPQNIFPSQGFIDRVAPYTDKVYITTLVTDYAKNEYASFNGNIIFMVSNDRIIIVCSGSTAKLKDTRWFLDNRRMPDAWLRRRF